MSTSAHAEEPRSFVIVLRATGPATETFAVNKALAADQTFVLASGARLTLLDNRGTWMLRGPLKFKIGKALDGTPVAINLATGTKVPRNIRTAGPRAQAIIK